MKQDYLKLPELNIGEMPTVVENEELNKTVTEKQQKV